MNHEEHFEDWKMQKIETDKIIFKGYKYSLTSYARRFKWSRDCEFMPRIWKMIKEYETWESKIINLSKTKNCILENFLVISPVGTLKSFLTFVLQVRKTPEKSHPRNLSRLGSNLGPLRDRRARYRQLHSGELTAEYITENS